jgi:hypothetical protein
MALYRKPKLHNMFKPQRTESRSKTPRRRNDLPKMRGAKSTAALIFSQGFFLSAIEHVALKFGDDEGEARNLCRKIAQLGAAKVC